MRILNNVCQEHVLVSSRMAEGGINVNQFSLFVIVLLIILADVLCGDGSVAPVKLTAVTASDSIWNKPNQNHPSAGWSQSGVSSTPTTTWPELGAKRQTNGQNSGNNKPFQTENRNIGVDLSYGLNANQNVNSRTNIQHTSLPNAPNSNDQNQYFNKPSGEIANRPNVQNTDKQNTQNLNRPITQNQNLGLDLSYGPGQAQIVPKKTNPQSNQYQSKQNNLPNEDKTQIKQNQPNLNQNVQNLNQDVWSNQGKTQEIIKNFQPSTLKQTVLSTTPSPLLQRQTPTKSPSSNPSGQNVLSGQLQPHGIVPSFPPSTVKQTALYTTPFPPLQRKTSTSGPSSNSAISGTPPATSHNEGEDEEYRQFFEQLIKKDNNNIAQHVVVNYQGKTTSRSQNDEAPQPLLDIKPAAYEVPSISRLLALYNNYIIETNVNEHVTAQERGEENALLDTILGSSVMQFARSFLVQKGAISKDPKDFRDKLKEIWFNMYSRGHGKIGSSGFEHVFLAEIKGKDVSGLHNWIYFKDVEAKGQANYLGYLKKFELGNKGAIIKYHFTLNGIDKPVGSMFVGTSPELELALYSSCFLLRPDKVCPLRYDGKNFIIRTYTFRYRGKNMIGSAFPEI